jgi:CRP/FNR family cyclic AMP-dependent transcriptional regulator
MPDIMQNILKDLLENDDFNVEVKYAIKNIDPNVKILNKDELHSDFYFILKGKLRVVISTTVGDAPLRPGIAELEEGAIFGEFTLFEELPACADVVTVTDAVLMEIDAISFRKFLNAHPDIGYQIFGCMINNYIKYIKHSNNAVLNLLQWGLKTNDVEKYR